MLNHEAAAEMIAKEGVGCHFTLLGDANMYFSQFLEARGARTIHVRHEHCALSMAMSYARATGDVGFCSVTCGPGLTQLATAIPAAVRARIPVVIFAGESPLHSSWYNQELDQGPIVQALGAEYIPVHSGKLLAHDMQKAFLKARRDHRPVVIGLPMDLQKEEAVDPTRYQPSTAVTPQRGMLRPDLAQVEAAAEIVAGAEKVVVLGGRGALPGDGTQACKALAETCSGLLATTLPARGAFHDAPFSVGIAGGFASALAREAFAEADVVVAVGASLAHHTHDGGKLFPKATVVQIDTSPDGINQGRVVADHFITGDAAATVAQLAEAVAGRGPRGNWRSDALAERIRTELADPEPEVSEPGVLDPRALIRELDAAFPKDWQMVNSSGHCSYFAAHMYGRPAETFHTIREFGAIGNGLSYAMGVAAARPDSTVVLFDGDGSYLMHSQELDTMRRHGLRVLVCVLNDGAYGSEIHKLRAEGFGDGGAVFGRGDPAAVARGHGVAGRRIDSLDDIGAALSAFNDHDGPEVWDFPISADVMSPVMRRAHPPK